MAEVIVKCKNCNNKVSIEQDWLGTEVECPYCEIVFFAEKPVKNTSSGKSNKKSSRKKKPSAGAIIGKIIGTFIKLIIFAAIIGGGAWFVSKKLTPTPESLKGNQLYMMTRKRVNNGGAMGMGDIARHDLFPMVKIKDDFFYHTCGFKDISLSSSGHNLYEGEVIILRNDKKYTRPVKVDHSQTFTHYYFPVDYRKNPEYLKEDADLIYALACQINKKLKSWQFKSCSKVEGNTLTVKVVNGGEEEEISMDVEVVSGKDNISRIWIEFPE